jgi:hypothetical protein
MSRSRIAASIMARDAAFAGCADGRRRLVGLLHVSSFGLDSSFWHWKVE